MAFSLRRNTDGGTIGLDIDGRFLAAAQVKDGRLEQVASAELPQGVLIDGEVVDRAGLTAALKDFVAEHKLPRHVQLGVSNQQIVVRVLELPRIDDDSERDAALRFQAAEAIAMPLDEAVLDHQIAGYVDNEDGGQRMQVVVVAARRTMIEEYLAAAKDAGLKAEGIDLDAFALVRMLAGQDRAIAAPVPEPVVETVPEPAPEPVVDAFTPDAEPVEPDLAPTAPLDVVPEPVAPEPDFTAPPASLDVARFESVAPVAAPTTAEASADGPPSARVYCHLGGVSNLAIAVGSNCYFSRTLSTPYDGDGASGRLADEIRLSIDYYMAQPNALPVGDVMLSGEGARDATLVADVGARLGIPAAAAAPLGDLDATLVAPGDDPYRYTVAAGLALGAAA
jgi:Tfp pilus assembly PilM family ATPase